MSYLVSIDGACRRNGKPDCVSGSGVFIQKLDEQGKQLRCSTVCYNEEGSTNQRGELYALLAAYTFLVCDTTEPVYIVTDSEYVFNAMNNDWLSRWDANGWSTASGDAVKNADIWQAIHKANQKCHDVTFYHIKGHVIPFGKVTARKLLNEYNGDKLLYNEVCKQYDKKISTRSDDVSAAQELSMKNNGFRLTSDILKQFVVANVVADALATKAVESLDRKSCSLLFPNCVI